MSHCPEKVLLNAEQVGQLIDSLHEISTDDLVAMASTAAKIVRDREIASDRESMNGLVRATIDYRSEIEKIARFK